MRSGNQHFNANFLFLRNAWCPWNHWTNRNDWTTMDCSKPLASLGWVSNHGILELDLYWEFGMAQLLWLSPIHCHASFHLNRNQAALLHLYLWNHQLPDHCSVVIIPYYAHLSFSHGAEIWFLDHWYSTFLFLLPDQQIDHKTCYYLKMPHSWLERWYMCTSNFRVQSSHRKETMRSMRQPWLVGKNKGWITL